MNISKKMSKGKYCKTNHISHNSLNTGLTQLGYKSRVKETVRDLLRPIETDLDRSRPIETESKSVKVKREKKNKTEPTEVGAGKPYKDEEIKEIFNNSFANLSVS